MVNKKVVIRVDAKEDDLHEFTILHGAHRFRMNCFLYKMDDILLLTGVDVEGTGQGTLGKNIHEVIQGVCDEFCEVYQTKRIILLGAKRTVGKTKGYFFNPIYRKKKNE